MSVVFSPKKLRRNGVIVMCGSILMVVAVTVYYEMNSATPWTSYAGESVDTATTGLTQVSDMYVLF